MFTGIIEEVGKISGIHKKGNSIRLIINAKTIAGKHIKAGDSVAVNGICLTAADHDATSFSADVMHETLNRTSLSRLKQGSPVNLERALPADGRFGGQYRYPPHPRHGTDH